MRAVLRGCDSPQHPTSGLGDVRVQGSVALTNAVFACARQNRWADCIAEYEQNLSSTAPDAITLHNLALASWQLARHAQARRYWQHASRLAPTNSLYSDMLSRLDAWVRACEGPLAPATLIAADIIATPFGPHHSQHAFTAIKADPQGSHCAGYPCFGSSAELRAWINWLRHSLDVSVYALVNPEQCGFLGFITLGRGGHFSYWISLRYRGNGYAGQALDLIQQLAFARQLDCLHSSVLATNHVSRRALDSAGFYCGGSGCSQSLVYSKSMRRTL